MRDQIEMPTIVFQRVSGNGERNLNKSGKVASKERMEKNDRLCSSSSKDLDNQKLIQTRTKVPFMNQVPSPTC